MSSISLLFLAPSAPASLVVSSINSENPGTEKEKITKKMIKKRIIFSLQLNILKLKNRAG
jgi:hypothetical protein